MVTIDGATAPARKGEGYDVGIKFSALGDKLQGSIDKFSTEQINTLAAELGGLKRGAIDAI